MNALLKKYRDISITELKEVADRRFAIGQGDKLGFVVMAELTGFGTSKCRLCRKYGCHKCPVYKATDTRCTTGINRDTYIAIGEAKTPIELYNAIQKRIKHLEEVCS